MKIKFELVNTDKEIDKNTWEKHELEFTEDLFNFFLKKNK